ncbi:16S rRNA (guanine(966)-N(2))-methyltransferase RsmD [Aestuariicella hydrocarbonica]|uniref:16S rRNA (Guanine(966)-N(2))-methyltransferase RsmD n=1 Tax=Pseudomaricurvus hydrocarbonicus TaxID=1470433 RepID=A0A9E5T4G5_9GAMM|nr:16S rRNA (guanine(966)-N(2))-methyltransferase RsmD [Aestuariicella hydrocarbonica]
MPGSSQLHASYHTNLNPSSDRAPRFESATLNKPRPAKSTPKQSGSQTLRIIGGQWRGRKLPFVSADGLRPTGDRIRETLFNWLMPDLPGANCLDVFSGSGALALEALSRGAKSATLLELNPQAAAQIRHNLSLLQCPQAQLVQTDSLSWLQRPTPPSATFDIVFVDPPFQHDFWQATITALEDHQWLSDGAAIYIETPKHLPLNIPANWHLHREKHAGDVSFRLFYRE